MNEHGNSPLIDIGVNLANAQFREDIRDVLQRAETAGVIAMILTGTSAAESEAVLRLCQQFADGRPGKLYCTAGVHPHEAKDWHSGTAARLTHLLANPAVVAVGETGLDFNRDYSPREQQEKTFEAQLEIAATVSKPLFMHERDAHRRQLDILRSHRDGLGKGVIHCFTGDRQALFNYLDLDFHIGITGWICDDRRGQTLRELVGNIPLNRLLIETDAPYLLPRNILPKPNARRNEPCYLPWVVHMIAQHRIESPAQLAMATTANAKMLFDLF